MQVTDHYCTLRINILEIHKPIFLFLQFRFLSCVLVHTALKMVRKRTENVAERSYIKARCKLGLSVKIIHDEICVVYRDKQMSFPHFLGGLQNSFAVRNQSKMPLIQE